MISLLRIGWEFAISGYCCCFIERKHAHTHISRPTQITQFNWTLDPILTPRQYETIPFWSPMTMATPNRLSLQLGINLMSRLVLSVQFAPELCVTSGQNILISAKSGLCCLKATWKWNAIPHGRWPEKASREREIIIFHTLKNEMYFDWSSWIPPIEGA